jgi:hypothetical protein
MKGPLHHQHQHHRPPAGQAAAAYQQQQYEYDDSQQQHKHEHQQADTDNDNDDEEEEYYYEVTFRGSVALHSRPDCAAPPTGVTLTFGDIIVASKRTRTVPVPVVVVGDDNNCCDAATVTANRQRQAQASINISPYPVQCARNNHMEDDDNGIMKMKTKPTSFLKVERILTAAWSKVSVSSQDDIIIDRRSSDNNAHANTHNIEDSRPSPPGDSDMGGMMACIPSSSDNDIMNISNLNDISAVVDDDPLETTIHDLDVDVDCDSPWSPTLDMVNESYNGDGAGAGSTRTADHHGDNANDGYTSFHQSHLSHSMCAEDDDDEEEHQARDQRDLLFGYLPMHMHAANDNQEKLVVSVLSVPVVRRCQRPHRLEWYGQCQSNSMSGSSSTQGQSQLPRLYCVRAKHAIPIRVSPSANAPTSRDMLLPCDLFLVECLLQRHEHHDNDNDEQKDDSTSRSSSSNATFLKLANGRGWVMMDVNVNSNANGNDNGIMEMVQGPLSQPSEFKTAHNGTLSPWLLCQVMIPASRRANHRPRRKKNDMMDCSSSVVSGNTASTRSMSTAAHSKHPLNNLSMMSHSHSHAHAGGNMNMNNNISLNMNHYHPKVPTVVSPAMTGGVSSPTADDGANHGYHGEDSTSALATYRRDLYHHDVEDNNESVVHPAPSSDKSMASSSTKQTAKSTSTTKMFYLMRVKAPKGLKVLDAPHFQVSSLIRGSGGGSGNGSGGTLPHATTGGSKVKPLGTSSMTMPSTGIGGHVAPSNQHHHHHHHPYLVANNGQRILPRGCIFEASSPPQRVSLSNHNSNSSSSEVSALIQLADGSGWAMLPTLEDLKQQHQQMIHFHRSSHNQHSSRSSDPSAAVEEVGNAIVSDNTATTEEGDDNGPNNKGVWLRVLPKNGVTVLCAPAIILKTPTSTTRLSEGNIVSAAISISEGTTTTKKPPSPTFVSQRKTMIAPMATTVRENGRRPPAPVPPFFNPVIPCGAAIQVEPCKERKSSHGGSRDVHPSDQVSFVHCYVLRHVRG